MLGHPLDYLQDVITRAKKDLKAGDVLDGIGGFLTYGIAENSPDTRKVCGGMCVDVIVHVYICLHAATCLNNSSSQASRALIRAVDPCCAAFICS